MICFVHKKILEILDSGNMPTDLTLFTYKKDGGIIFDSSNAPADLKDIFF
jgi:hypothetical protein